MAPAARRAADPHPRLPRRRAGGLGFWSIAVFAAALAVTVLSLLRILERKLSLKREAGSAAAEDETVQRPLETRPDA